jgi:hypothetical protein
MKEQSDSTVQYSDETLRSRKKRQPWKWFVGEKVGLEDGWPVWLFFFFFFWNKKGLETKEGREGGLEGIATTTRLGVTGGSGVYDGFRVVMSLVA